MKKVKKTNQKKVNKKSTLKSSNKTNKYYFGGLTITSVSSLGIFASSAI